MLPSGSSDRLSPSPDRLFVYGSLMFDDVLGCLIDRIPARASALAPDWAVVGLRGQVYPGLVRAAGSTASGQVIADLTASEWKLLDAFENPIYGLEHVRLADGQSASAYTATTDEALETSWDAVQFEAEHLPAYVIRCTSWRGRYELRQRTA